MVVGIGVASTLHRLLSQQRGTKIQRCLGRRFRQSSVEAHLLRSHRPASRRHRPRQWSVSTRCQLQIDQHLRLVLPVLWQESHHLLKRLLHGPLSALNRSQQSFRSSHGFTLTCINVFEGGKAIGHCCYESKMLQSRCSDLIHKVLDCSPTRKIGRVLGRSEMSRAFASMADAATMPWKRAGGNQR